ncbi:hypothetical protein, partial [Pedobacter zeae]|uniref:hypothetical protein n=1 Tax=Pedobacter zeae TaxID=1737356 RepID=UPI001C842393
HSGSGFSSERTESGTEAHQRNGTAHFLIKETIFYSETSGLCFLAVFSPAIRFTLLHCYRKACSGLFPEVFYPSI